MTLSRGLWQKPRLRGPGAVYVLASPTGKRSSIYSVVSAGS